MIVARHFSAAPTGPDGALPTQAWPREDGGEIMMPAHWPPSLCAAYAAVMPEGADDAAAWVDQRLRACAQTLKARQWLRAEEAELFLQEAGALVLQARIALLPQGPALVALALDDALQGGGDALVVADVAADNLDAALDLLCAQRRYRGADAPARLLLPVEAAPSLGWSGRRLADDIAAAAEDFGAPHLRAALEAVMDACDRDRLMGFDPARHAPLAAAVRHAKALGVSDAALATVLALAAEGAEGLPWLRARNRDHLPQPPLVTLALPDAFIEAALTGHGFLQNGPAGEHHADAAALLDELTDQLWMSGQPQIFFRDHQPQDAALAKALRENEGAGAGALLPAGIALSQGAIGLRGFASAKGLDVAGIAAATRVLVLLLAAEEAVAGAISLTDLSPALMTLGIAYDSPAARSHAAGIAALVTASAAETAALLAARSGLGMAQGRHGLTRELQAMQASFNGTAFAAGDASRSAVAVNPQHLDAAAARFISDALARAADAVRQHGVALAPFTVVDTPDLLQALLDVRAADLAPMAALVEQDAVQDLVFAPARGVYRRRIWAGVPQALGRLGYTPAQIDDIHFYVVGHGTLFEAPRISHATLRQKGFDDQRLAQVDAALASARELAHALNPYVVGHDFCVTQLGLSPAEMDRPGFDLAAALGFDDDAIAAAALYACGTGGLEGAPHLRPEHLAVFDTDTGFAAHHVRRVSAEARLLMQAAIEPFLLGGVAQVLTLHPDTSRDDLRALLLKGWQLGVRILSLYRAGCGLDSPVALVLPAVDDRQDIDFEEETEKPAALTTR